MRVEKVFSVKLVTYLGTCWDLQTKYRFFNRSYTHVRRSHLLLLKFLRPFLLTSYSSNIVSIFLRLRIAGSLVTRRSKLKLYFLQCLQLLRRKKNLFDVTWVCKLFHGFSRLYESLVRPRRYRYMSRGGVLSALMVSGVFKQVLSQLHFRYGLRTYKLLWSINERARLMLTRSPNPKLLGGEFFGKAFFNMYLKYSFLQKSLFYVIKLFFHLYSFFFWKTKLQFEFIFFSPTVHGLFTSLMRNGNKVGSESIFFSLFSSFKIFIGLPATLVVINSILSSRMILNRTHIFLSGRGHLVPTPGMFDKQYKSAIRNIKTFMRKRQYLRDVIKRSLIRGRYVGRRAPLYRRLNKLSTLFVKNQNFFVLNTQRSRGMRFLKSDVFNVLRKNVYLFILQRTYVQYRWR